MIKFRMGVPLPKLFCCGKKNDLQVLRNTLEGHFRI